MQSVLKDSDKVRDFGGSVGFAIKYDRYSEGVRSVKSTIPSRSALPERSKMSITHPHITQKATSEALLNLKR